MTAEERLQILKFVSMVLNSIFAIIGLALFGCGMWILFDKSSFILMISGEGSMKIVAGGLFVIGLVVVGVSALGYVGAWKEIRLVIILFIGILIVIFLGQLFIIFVLFIKMNQITSSLTDEVDEIIRNYGNGTKFEWNLLDGVQRNFNCCGRYNYTQWENNSYIQSLGKDVYPCSCYNTTSCPFHSNDTQRRFGSGSNVYHVGCQKSISDWFWENSISILGMGLGLVFFQILQSVLCIQLFKDIGRKAKPDQRYLLDSHQANPQD